MVRSVCTVVESTRLDEPLHQPPPQPNLPRCTYQEVERPGRDRQPLLRHLLKQPPQRLDLPTLGENLHYEVVHARAVLVPFRKQANN